jgi:hypothetical protein
MDGWMKKEYDTQNRKANPGKGPETDGALDHYPFETHLILHLTPLVTATTLKLNYRPYAMLESWLSIFIIGKRIGI